MITAICSSRSSDNSYLQGSWLVWPGSEHMFPGKVFHSVLVCFHPWQCSTILTCTSCWVWTHIIFLHSSSQQAAFILATSRLFIATSGDLPAVQSRLPHTEPVSPYCWPVYRVMMFFMPWDTIMISFLAQLQHAVLQIHWHVMRLQDIQPRDELVCDLCDKHPSL
jgi:hypothetical protein